MKKIKIVLDIIMFISMILLMKTNITGLQLHEILGICLFIIFIIHKIINFKWVKSVGKNILNKNMKSKSKIMFSLDLILFVFIILNVITGILVSKFILVSITANNIETVTILHKFFAWWSLILISIHIGLHWENFVNYFERKFKSLKENKILHILFILLYITITIIGIWSISRASVYSKLILKIHNEQKNSVEIKNYDSPQQYRERKFKNQKSQEEQKNDYLINNETQKNSSSIDNTTNIPTLEEYLSQFTCDGCRKQCSLLNPSCEIGKKEREEKIQEYYQKYGEMDEEEGLKSDNRPSRLPNAENNRKYQNRTNIINVISIMWMFIGGTYYINKVMKLKRK